MAYVVNEPPHTLIRGDFADDLGGTQSCRYCSVGWLMKEVLGASGHAIMKEESYDEGLCLELQGKLGWDEEDISQIVYMNDRAEPDLRIGILKDIVDKHSNLIWEARAFW